MNTCPPSPRLAPHPRLVPHEIRLPRDESAPGACVLVATIECERRGQTLPVDVCRFCPRFCRIEVHEAGYTMLCRSSDEDLSD